MHASPIRPQVSTPASRPCDGSCTRQESEGAGTQDAAVWETVLDGLQAAAQLAAQPLFDAVLSWRREMLARVNKLSAESSVPTVLVVCKRVMLVAGQLPGRSQADMTAACRSSAYRCGFRAAHRAMHDIPNGLALLLSPCILASRQGMAHHLTAGTASLAVISPQLHS